jgi:hypothetical protein
MNLENFRTETDPDGIAVLTWDMPGRSMNVNSRERPRPASPFQSRG